MAVKVESPLPQGDEKVRSVRAMFDAIAPRYDLVNRIMTLRMDVRWRRRTVRSLALPDGSTVVDLACGTGDLCDELARSGHRPVGVVDGLPVGAQLIGRRFADVTCLAAAELLENALGILTPIDPR